MKSAIRRGVQPALLMTTDTLSRFLLASNEADLVRFALDLGAARFGGPLSVAEERLSRSAMAITAATAPELLQVAARSILAGQDPLGVTFCELRPAATRRKSGAIYTPPEIVRPMVDWTLAMDPSRVVDAGAGSGRFSLAVSRKAPSIQLIAVDSDPLATILTRAALAVAGHKSALVLNNDYTTVRLPVSTGRTAFLGNPPYVRHHDLTARTKDWGQAAARQMNQPMSGLAGLHAYFFLSTAMMGARGDVGCFVTSSEWLDVNYGAVIRELLLGPLGGSALHVLEPTAAAFQQTATTAAITCFTVGDRPKSMRLRRVKAVNEIDPLAGGRQVSRERLAEARRWTPFIRAKVKAPEGYIELGELCSVHRGTVTGSNSVWIREAYDDSLPSTVLLPSVTRALELFAAGDVLADSAELRRVVALPEDLDMLDRPEREAVTRFLDRAKRAGAADGYVARNRKAWWSVGLREPAPILATYMARRAPAFVRNLAEARHVNIAHGLYPRSPLSKTALDRLAAALRSSVTVAQGRTYAGGLTKFEPKEMERLLVPDVRNLAAL